MNFKQNINYFKTSDLTKAIGIGLMLLSVALYFFGWGYISYILMSICLPVGALLFILGSGKRSSDSDIDEYVKRITGGLEIDLIEDKDFAKKLDKSFSPMIFEGFEYDEGLMLTKAKSGSVRSSRYTKAVIYVLHNSLYILNRSFSLIEDEIKNSNCELALTDIDRIELVANEKNLTFEKKVFNVKYVRLNIILGGNVYLSLPAPNDINTDQLVDKINSAIQRAKSNQ